MDSYEKVIANLNSFTKKFYTKKLLKGLVLFLLFGGLAFLLITSVEYFLWLNKTGRLVLFICLLVGIVILLLQFIVIPLMYLFKLRKGLSKEDAAIIVGKHFDEVDDKLLNLLQLSEDSRGNELAAASINQRSHSLKDVVFATAVRFGDLIKYIKYLAIPLLIFLSIFFSGNLDDFFGSYTRVTNFDVAYTPPAPFHFRLLNDKLQVIEGEVMEIGVEVYGDVIPNNVFIVIDGKELIMQRNGLIFTHTIEAPIEDVSLYFQSNEVVSEIHTLSVIKAPKFGDFEMVLDYPNYLGKRTEVIKNTGNAVVPEGTLVTWHVNTIASDKILFNDKDSIQSLEGDKGQYNWFKRLYKDLDYEVSVSNKTLQNYETLEYGIEVVNDLYPTIRVGQTLDSLNVNMSYFSGIVNDDQEVRSVTMVCYASTSPNDKIKVPITFDKVSGQFYYTFPTGVNLDEGKLYKLLFEVKDNDGLRGGKTTRSKVFDAYFYDQQEVEKENLNNQKELIKGLDDSLKSFKDQEKVLKEIQENQKSENQLDFNDENKLKQFINQQQQQEDMMKKFSKELKENLDRTEEDDRMKELLKDRLERQEKEAEKNKKLLEELKKIADKISKDELQNRLDEIAKNKSKNNRNLEQLVELTKRYYVTEKASRIAEELKKLADKQLDLSENDKVGEKEIDEQNRLNDDFNKIAEDLKELEKDNQDLKKPLDIDVKESLKEGVKKDQQEALDKLNDVKEGGNSNAQDSKEAKNKQKSAGDKMKEMSESLSSSSMQGSESSISEDAEMLRQILDNLITFSFKQEALFDKVSDFNVGGDNFSSNIKSQKQLRGMFEYVDDSLFALSLRQAEISEFVNEQITEVYYNIDKALEAISDNRAYQGASHQQYVVNASNSLADFLADLLDNMQSSMMSGQGQGQGSDFQLPDIIKGQGALQEKMNQSGQQQSGSEPQEGEGSEGSQGKEGQQQGQGKEGGKKGESAEGKEGENGKQGKGKNGEQGNSGKGEKGKGKGKGNQIGDGGSGEGEGMSEQELQEIYEIYKEQQTIRMKLEDQLKNIIDSNAKGLADKIVKEMEQFENELLSKGITQRTITKMNNIQHQLLKLENAALKQGRKEERESKNIKRVYTNPITTKPEYLKKSGATEEILNREALPLHHNYKEKVNKYFNE